MGFKQLESDHSIYIIVRGDVRIIIPVFINDITFTSSNPAAIDSAIKELASHFKLCDLGPTSFLLGIEIVCNPDTQQILLSQRQYIIDALERYHMSDCNPIGTPMDLGAHLSSSMPLQSKSDGKHSLSQCCWYSSIPGHFYSSRYLICSGSTRSLQQEHWNRTLEGSKASFSISQRDTWLEACLWFIWFTSSIHHLLVVSGHCCAWHIWVLFLHTLERLCPAVPKLQHFK